MPSGQIKVFIFASATASAFEARANPLFKKDMSKKEKNEIVIVVFMFFVGSISPEKRVKLRFEFSSLRRDIPRAKNNTIREPVQAADYSIFLSNSYLAAPLAAFSGYLGKAWVQILVPGPTLTYCKIFPGKGLTAPKKTSWIRGEMNESSAEDDNLPPN